MLCILHKKKGGFYGLDICWFVCLLILRVLVKVAIDKKLKELELDFV